VRKIGKRLGFATDDITPFAQLLKVIEGNDIRQPMCAHAAVIPDQKLRSAPSTNPGGR
jgi:hypothetical protein